MDSPQHLTDILVTCTNYNSILALQVSLGIHLKNENKTDEMADIMEHLQQYVPSKRISESFQVSESKEVELEIDHFCHILFGGDQLTVARARGAQGVLCNSHNGFDRLKGLVPVVEDWHAKVTFMKVILDPGCLHNFTSLQLF